MPLGKLTIALVLLLTAAPAFAADRALIEAMKLADPPAGPVLRRPKFLTDGTYDTADPSSPIRYEFAEGRAAWMILFSGGSVIYDDNLEGLLRGGPHPRRDIEFRYADGASVTTKPYRINAAPWDPDLSSFTNAKGQREWVGYAGMMEKRADGREPTRAKDNWSRSRHAFSVSIRRAEAGAIEQSWSDLGPVHGDRPHDHEGAWLSPTHAHGYGSHYIEAPDGTPYLFFEEVSEQRNGGPYRTEIFARRLSPDRRRGIGAKLAVLKVAPRNKPAQPFKAAARSGGGYLVEGPHLTEVRLAGREFYLLFFSAGDAFTDRYGNFYAYREKSGGLFGEFTPYVSGDGELVDITGELTKAIDGTWGVGRLNPFRDESGQLWGAGHVILKQEIPDGELKSGWPPTYEQLVKRARRTLLVPLEVTLDSAGRPQVRLTRP